MNWNSSKFFDCVNSSPQLDTDTVTVSFAGSHLQGTHYSTGIILLGSRRVPVSGPQQCTFAGGGGALLARVLLSLGIAVLIAVTGLGLSFFLDFFLLHRRLGDQMIAESWGQKSADPIVSELNILRPRE